MALITCPECSGSASDQAATCPHCGYPIKSVDLLAVEGDQSKAQAQLVELTAKRLKKHYVIATFISTLSIILASGTCIRANIDQRGYWAAILFSLLFVGGFLYLVTIRFLIWWHHR